MKSKAERLERLSRALQLADRENLDIVAFVVKGEQHEGFMVLDIEGALSVLQTSYNHIKDGKEPNIRHFK